MIFTIDNKGIRVFEVTGVTHEHAVCICVYVCTLDGLMYEQIMYVCKYVDVFADSRKESIPQPFNLKPKTECRFLTSATFKAGSDRQQHVRSPYAAQRWWKEDEASAWAAAVLAVTVRSSRAGRRMIDGRSGGKAMRGQATALADYAMSQDFTTLPC